MPLNCNLTMVEMGNFMLFMFTTILKEVKSKGSRDKHVFDSPRYHCQAERRLLESALGRTYQSLPSFISFLLSLGFLISLSHLALRFHKLFCFLFFFFFKAQNRGTDKLVTSFMYFLGTLCLPLWRAGSTCHEAFSILSILSCS